MHNDNDLDDNLSFYGILVTYFLFIIFFDKQLASKRINNHIGYIEKCFKE